MNLRLEKAGYQIWWLPAARIRHFIAAERLRIGWQIRHEFRDGRSRALVRLQAVPERGRRLLLLVGRLLAAPFHCAINLVLAALASVVLNQRLAVRALVRAARVAGLGWQLLLEVPKTLSSRPVSPKPTPDR